MQENLGAAIRSATVLAAIAFTIALAEYAAGSSRAPANADPAESAEARACLPDPALPGPQPAPDCEFGRSHRKTLDAEQFLKLEFERNRYRNAEKATRETLRKPQAVSRCEVTSVTP